MKENKQKFLNVVRKKIHLPDLGKHPRLAKLLNTVFVFLSFSICLAVSYHYWTHSPFNESAYKYSTETYEYIEEILGEYINPEVGADIITLREEIPIGDIHWENDDTILTASIPDGYFNAVVTAKFTKDCTITSSFRNYNSRGEYMNSFWSAFGLNIFLSALVAWILIELSFSGLSYLVSKKATSKSKSEVVNEEGAQASIFKSEAQQIA